MIRESRTRKLTRARRFSARRVEREVRLSHARHPHGLPSIAL